MENKKLLLLQLLFVAPIVGAILGYGLSSMIDYGWFTSSWQMIFSPPVHVSALLAVSEDSLWVRSDSGEIYYNEHASGCEKCWYKVSSFPEEPTLGVSLKVTRKPCAPIPPLWGAVASVSECRSSKWEAANTTFTLLNDGSIQLWQTTIYGEGGFLGQMAGAVIGAVALFVFALCVVLFLFFFKALRAKFG